MTDKIKVAFTYIVYPVAMARYMLEALRRRPDVEVWVAGPFTGRRIPWQGGMFLPQLYVDEPDLPLPSSVPPEINYPFVERHLPWTPDIWIEGNAGLQTIGRPKDGVYVVIGTDPHVLNYDVQRAKADMFYCMQRPYMKPGDRWLPYAFAPDWHKRTTTPWAKRSIDIALVGLPYPDRKRFMTQMRALGFNAYMKNGPAYRDAWEIYSDAKLGLNLSSRDDLTARVFELMAMGVVPIINRVSDLGLLFTEGEHYIGFSTVHEGVNAATNALRDPESSMTIADAAARKVREDNHTWDARMERVLQEAGLL